MAAAFVEVETTPTSDSAQDKDTHAQARSSFDHLVGVLPGVEREEFPFKDWHFVSTKSHILRTDCLCPRARSDFTAGGAPLPIPPEKRCRRCVYESQLELPILPEMIFDANRLILSHVTSGAAISFNAFDALKRVDPKHASLTVSATAEWRNARKDVEQMDVVKPFDWTYTTDYAGTVSSNIQILPTEERIDLEKLKVREPILFYSELTLFEDELGDNGASELTLKFRCMPSGFFLLQRFYLRVDHVTVRVIDTRLHWQAERPGQLLREWSRREANYGDLEPPARELMMDANQIGPHLRTIEERREKLILPGISTI